MTDSQALRPIMLSLLAAAGADAIPMPVEYWRRQLICVVGPVSKAQTEEILFALEDAKLIESQLDPFSVRRFRVTPQGLAANMQPTE